MGHNPAHGHIEAGRRSMNLKLMAANVGVLGDVRAGKGERSKL